MPSDPGNGRLFLFDPTKDGADALASRMKDGDLVLLKASVDDHPDRAVLKQTIAVASWQERRGRLDRCEDCGLGLVPSPRPDANGG